MTFLLADNFKSLFSKHEYSLTPPRPAEPIRSRYECTNPMIDALGTYENYRQQLQDERKRDFQTFLRKVFVWFQ